MLPDPGPHSRSCMYVQWVTLNLTFSLYYSKILGGCPFNGPLSGTKYPTRAASPIQNASTPKSSLPFSKHCSCAREIKLCVQVLQPFASGARGALPLVGGVCWGVTAGKRATMQVMLGVSLRARWDATLYMVCSLRENIIIIIFVKVHALIKILKCATHFFKAGNNNCLTIGTNVV